MPKLEFYDPLYEHVNLLIHSSASLSSSEFDPSPFINTPEFARQAYLRQSGMKFLVFPSSTHTRFAHALGACYLGRLAIERVTVADHSSDQEERSLVLGDFLKKHRLTEVFLLALLLHDIGHFPFSHTLEQNPLVRQRISSHEEAACELVLGKGGFYEALSRGRDELLSINSKRVALSRIVKDKIKPRKNAYALCYLISSNEEYLGKALRADPRGETRKAALKVLHTLVSGLLDLDRIDHYRRDCFFNGFHQGTGLNYLSLLSGVAVRYSPLGRGFHNARLKLSPEAMGQAIALLQLKDRLTESVFQHPGVLAFEAMLNQAVTLHLTGHPDETLDLLVQTDDVLLHRLANSDDPQVRGLAGRVMCRSPYHFLAKLVCRKCLNRDVVQTRAQELLFGAGSVLLLYSKAYIRATRAEKGAGGPLGEWLNLNRLDVEGSYTVSRMAVEPKVYHSFKRYKDFWQRPESQPIRAMWIFTEHKPDPDRLGEPLQALVKLVDADIDDCVT